MTWLEIASQRIPTFVGIASLDMSLDLNLGKTTSDLDMQQIIDLSVDYELTQKHGILDLMHLSYFTPDLNDLLLDLRLGKMTFEHLLKIKPCHAVWFSAIISVIVNVNYY